MACSLFVACKTFISYTSFSEGSSRLRGITPVTLFSSKPEVNNISKNLLKLLLILGLHNYICVSAIGSNIKFIKDNSYKKHSKVYYYTYNYCMPEIKASECVININ